MSLFVRKSDGLVIDVVDWCDGNNGARMAVYYDSTGDSQRIYSDDILPLKKCQGVNPSYISEGDYVNMNSIPKSGRQAEREQQDYNDAVDEIVSDGIAAIPSVIGGIVRLFS